EPSPASRRNSRTNRRGDEERLVVRQARVDEVAITCDGRTVRQSTDCDSSIDTVGVKHGVVFVVKAEVERKARAHEGLFDEDLGRLQEDSLPVDTSQSDGVVDLLGYLTTEGLGSQEELDEMGRTRIRSTIFTDEGIFGLF